jgi:hypothetical protein
MAVQPREYYSPKGNTDRFLTKPDPDALERDFIDAQVSEATMAIEKLLTKYSDRPEFARKVVMAMANRAAPKQTEERDWR